MSSKVIRKNPFIYTVGLKDGKSILIEKLCESLEISYVRLMESDRYRTIKEITGNIEHGIMPLGVETESKNFSPGNGNSPEVLIFSNLTEKKLDDFLDAYKAMGIEPVGLKAVVTKTNEGWTIEALTAELIKERAAMLFSKRS